MQPEDACGLGRIYLVFPILISMFLCELVRSRQPAIPEVKSRPGISFFSFLFFVEISPFLFSLICDFGSQKGESIPEDGSTGSPNPAVLTECGVKAFWPGRGNLSLFPSFLPSPEDSQVDFSPAQDFPLLSGLCSQRVEIISTVFLVWFGFFPNLFYFLAVLK